MKSKKLWAALVAVGVFGLAAASASATIIFTAGNNPQPDEANILFGAKEVGTLITGEVDHSGVAAMFSSLQSLTQDSSGQADISATGPKGTEITNITFFLPAGFFFTDFIMDPQHGHGTATVTVQTQGATHAYSLGNGQNFLTITTDANDLMSSVSIQMDSNGGFLDFKQPRVSGVCEQTSATDGCTPIQETPEPATLGLLSLGLLGLGLAGRRRKA